MKKKLLLITTRKDMMILYLEELTKIFEGYLELFSCCLQEEKPEEIILEEADIILVTSPYTFFLGRNKMKATSKVINLNFTFKKEKIEELKKLPINTDAVACFDFSSSSHQAAFTLQEAGVDNLNIFPYYSGNPNLENKEIETAIISEYATEIPEKIKYIIDLGRRKIAFATILDIVIKSNILDEIIEERIYNYFKDTAIPNGYLSYFYDGSSVVKMQLNTIINCIDYGIIILDNEYNIVNFNKKFIEFFNLKGNITNFNLNELEINMELKKAILENFNIKDQLFEIKEFQKRILLSKEKINKKDLNYNIFIVLMKDITDIINLENYLRKQIAKKGHIAKYTFDDIKGNSLEIKDCLERAEKIGKIDKPTLILGESGTGKELFAHSIHNVSIRKKFPFIAANCAAIPANLLESELFGYEEGAFTGAKKGGKIGIFEMAHKGTLFLDEIGELSLETQAKLLRVVEDKEIRRIGSSDIISCDVRIIAATNRNLEELIEKGKFRLDLYYRLNTLIIEIPPLRERKEDVPQFIKYFFEKESKVELKIEEDVLNFLIKYEWKGNIRELRNCIEYMANVYQDKVKMKDLPIYIYKKYLNENKKEIKVEKNNNKDENGSYFDKKVLLKILELLQKQNIGRRRLKERLEYLDIDISEYKLREIILYFNKKEYIFSSKGRKGIFLTEKGKNFLKELENNNIK